MTNISSLFQDGAHAGKTLNGRFRLERLLGKGGMGEVYLARDTTLERDVAVKIVTMPQGVGGKAFRNHLDTFIERFRREARGLAKIRHPNVVQVYDQFDVDGLPAIVMEYVEGETLDDRLEEAGCFSPTEAAQIMRGVLLGLHAAHEAGIIHRDVKPGNVMLTASGEPKLLDFGLVKMAESDLLGKDLTTEGVAVGTMRFMAPEQLRNELVDARTDIYAAGIMFYMLLTGKTPYNGSQGSIIMGHLQQEPPPMDELALLPIPPGFQAVAKKAIAKDPADRYQTAHQMERAVSRAMLEQHAPPPPPPEAFGKPVRVQVIRELAPELEPSGERALVRTPDVRTSSVRPGLALGGVLVIVGFLGALSLVLHLRQKNARKDVPSPQAEAKAALPADAIDADTPVPVAPSEEAQSEIVIEEEPYAAPASAEKGCELQRTDNEAAVLELERRIADAPKDADALFCLCRAYHRLGGPRWADRGVNVCKAFRSVGAGRSEYRLVGHWLGGT